METKKEENTRENHDSKEESEEEMFYESFEELMFDSCRYGEIENLKYALENNPDINYMDRNFNTSLHMAAANGHIKCIKLLFEYSKKNQKVLNINS